MNIRRLGFAAAVALVLPAAGRAQVDNTTGTSLTADDFLMRLWQERGGRWILLSDFEEQLFFNQARCLCDEPVRITVQLTARGKSKAQAINRGVFSVLVGPVACVSENDAARSTATCLALAGDTNLVQLARIPQMVIDTTVNRLFGGTCSPVKRQEFLRIFLDVDRNQIPDLTGEAAPFRAIQLDSEAPPAPQVDDVGAGNEALNVSWANLEGYEDFRGYLVFCSRGEDLAVFSPSDYNQQYHTPQTRCPERNLAVLEPVPQALRSLSAGSIHATEAALDTAWTWVPTPYEQALANPIAQHASGLPSARGPFVAPAHFRTLDPAYLCSDIIPSSTSHRVAGLQNGIPYLVGVASVDKHGNASSITTVYLQTPIATRDFYTGYRAAGGAAEGGYCALAPDGGRTARWPWFALGTLLLLTALSRPRRCPTRRGRAACPAAERTRRRTRRSTAHLTA